MALCILLIKPGDINFKPIVESLKLLSGVNVETVILPIQYGKERCIRKMHRLIKKKIVKYTQISPPLPVVLLASGVSTLFIRYAYDYLVTKRSDIGMISINQIEEIRTYLHTICSALQMGNTFCKIADPLFLTRHKNNPISVIKL